MNHSANQSTSCLDNIHPVINQLLPEIIHDLACLILRRFTSIHFKFNFIIVIVEQFFNGFFKVIQNRIGKSLNKPDLG